VHHIKTREKKDYNWDKSYGYDTLLKKPSHPNLTSPLGEKNEDYIETHTKKKKKIFFLYTLYNTNTQTKQKTKQIFSHRVSNKSKLSQTASQIVVFHALKM
jgi:hypothetical protein